MCNEVLVNAHREILLGEISVMMREDRRQDLGLMHFLLQRIDGGLDAQANVCNFHVLRSFDRSYTCI